MVDLAVEVEMWLRGIIRAEIVAAGPPFSSEEPEAKPVKAQDSLLNMKLAADYLGVSKVALYRFKKRGEIGYYGTGNRALFSVQKHILPFLESREILIRSRIRTP